MSTLEENVIVTEDQPSELDLLKERATLMGITFHPTIGLEKLKAKVDAKLTGTPDPTEEAPAVPVAPVAAPLTEYERNQGLRDASSRLIRVVVSCMNPAKQVWEGEFITVSNRAIGTLRKYVPFNLDAGYHIPFAIYEQLLERQCQVFYTQQDSRTGLRTRKGRLIKEFNVVVLPDLTEAELKELALQQAANQSID